MDPLMITFLSSYVDYFGLINLLTTLRTHNFSSFAKYMLTAVFSSSIYVVFYASWFLADDRHLLHFSSSQELFIT